MPTYAIVADLCVPVTRHDTADATARRRAVEEVQAALAATDGDGSGTRWTVGPANVVEYPAAPFEPFQLGVSVSVSVRVDASSSEEAVAAGRAAIDAALAEAGFDGARYVDGPAVAP